MTKYTHLKLNEEQRFLPGSYVPCKEVRLPYDGREVLYVAGEATLDSACCNTGNFSYIIVPGYVVKWQSETSKEGLPVTEVEAVKDRAAQEKLREIVQKAECISHIEFW